MSRRPPPIRLQLSLLQLLFCVTVGAATFFLARCYPHILIIPMLVCALFLFLAALTLFLVLLLTVIELLLNFSDRLARNEYLVCPVPRRVERSELD